MKKAQGSPSTQPQPQVIKASPPTIHEKKEAPIPTTISVSPQDKPDIIGKKRTSISTENQENKPTQATTQPTEMPKLDPSTKFAVPQKPEPSKEETGFFSFGFGGARSGSPQPSVTVVPGKVLGFGSSFLNSASNLISSAIQDDSSTLPPTSEKTSTTSETSAKTTTPPTSYKASVVSQTSVKTTPTPPFVTSQKVPPTDTNAPLTETPKEEKTDEKQVQQATAVPEALVVAPVAPKTESKACPLCKVDLNVGSQDTPNYNTCTECKKIVCNLCGFNPTPHQTEVREYYTVILYWYLLIRLLMQQMHLLRYNRV